MAAPPPIETIVSTMMLKNPMASAKAISAMALFCVVSRMHQAFVSDGNARRHESLMEMAGLVLTVWESPVSAESALAEMTAPDRTDDGVLPDALG
ncbi:MAG: hypothetical protein GKS00_25970 [Alphaproteobacteria bacterium]|nr:hypothetical protein [Alphaproteobacteria bacterium]